MRRSLAALGIVTAGVTVFALASPVLAQPGPNPVGGNAASCPMADGDGSGQDFGRGMMNGTDQNFGRGGMMNGTDQNFGRGGMMNGNGPGTGINNGAGMGGGMRGSLANLPPMGTLTADQQATLASMAEEDKLAHDVYVALAARFPEDYQFARIARSESMHQAALRTLLTRYGLTDPSANLATGQFSTSAFQKLYDDLVAQATTAQNALGVGVAVEKLDIADLTSALTGLTAPDVTQVYTNLRNASQHHLAAFGG